MVNVNIIIIYIWLYIDTIYKYVLLYCVMRGDLLYSKCKSILNASRIIFIKVYPSINVSSTRCAVSASYVQHNIICNIIGANNLVYLLLNVLSKQFERPHFPTTVHWFDGLINQTHHFSFLFVCLYTKLW